MIDIRHLDKADVLRALYNRARPQGMGFLSFTSGNMPKEEAQLLLTRSTYFDYVKGRVLKVDLSGNTLDPRLYDRDNGQGAAQAAIDHLLEELTKP